MSMKDLSAERAEIDSIDEKIIKLLARRIKIVTVIGQMKKSAGILVRDTQREQIQMKKIIELCKTLDADPLYIALVFRVIIDCSVRLQQGKDAISISSPKPYCCSACDFNTTGCADNELRWPVCLICETPLVI